MMYPKIQAIINKIDFLLLSPERQVVLNEVVVYILSKQEYDKPVSLNFICTHNSRRSQFSQLWAAVAASYFKIRMQSYSGGVEVTAFNERAINSLERFGFKIQKKGTTNPKYQISWSSDEASISMFSKMVDHELNPKSNFVAIMTCSHADENCPLITGCDQRIALRYEDPKAYDDTPLEEEMYDARSIQIATEMFYVFSEVRKIIH